MALLLAVAAGGGLSMPAQALGNNNPTYYVTNNSASISVQGSLAYEIDYANNHPAPQGAVNVIEVAQPFVVQPTPALPLPSITAPLILDGQQGNLTIDDGPGAQSVGLTFAQGSIGSQVNGVRIEGAGSAGILLEDRGIQVGKNPQSGGSPDPDVLTGNTGDGILISGSGATGEQIYDDLIGTDANGVTTAPTLNGGAGVAFTGGASGAIHGGVISAGPNSPAVDLGGANNTVDQVTLAGSGPNLIVGGRSVDVGPGPVQPGGGGGSESFQADGGPAHGSVGVDLYSFSCSGPSATLVYANGTGSASTDAAGSGTGSIFYSGTFPSMPFYLASGNGTDSVPNPCTDVALAAAGPKLGNPGSPVSYVFTISNSGPGPATGIAFTAPLPSGAVNASASTAAGTCSVVGTIACRLGGLAPGGSATVTVTLTPTALGTLTASGSVALGDVNESDENPTNNGASVSTTVVPAGALPPDVPPPVSAGQASASGTNATMPVTCSGSSGPTCPITATMTVDQTPAEPSLKGVFDPASATWTLQTPSGKTTSFVFGSPGDIPVTGDWTGSGRTGIGVFRPSNGLWLLRNQANAGFADAVIVYGSPGDIPLTGDWTGSGHFGIGVFRPSTGTWLLRNTASTGFADVSFQFGLGTWRPVTGDWNGDGIAGIGAVDPTTGTWYLRNEAGAGSPDAGAFAFGVPGWLPVTGDWTGSGSTGIGVVDPATVTWYLRNEVGAGAPDAGTSHFGAAGLIPVSGAWNVPAGSVTHAARSGKAKKPKKPKPIVVGTSKTTIHAGGSRTIKVALNAEGRRLLSQRHTLRVILVIKDGSTQVAKRTLTFRAKHHG